MTKEQFIKIRHKLATCSQPFRQKLGRSKPGFYGARCTLLFKKGRGLCTNAHIQIFYRTSDRRCSFCCLFRMLISPTTRAICGLTDRCTTARFTRLAWRKPGRPRSFALPAMSRLPFALGKCLPCSSPMSDDATSVIHNSRRCPRSRPAGIPDGNHPVTSPVSNRRTMQAFWNGSGPPPLSPGLSISLHSRCEPSPKPVRFS